MLGLKIKSYRSSKCNKKIIGEDVLLETTPTNDNRSYHISSKDY